MRRLTGLVDLHALLDFNRDVRMYLAAWALFGLGYFGVQGVLLNLYLVRLGFDAGFIGRLTASGQFAWAACALPAGAFGRRFGPRAALLAGSALSALGTGLLLAVEALPRDTWTLWLYGTWIAGWVGGALLAVNSTPYLMHASAVEERHRAFAAQSAVVALTGFGGSLAAGQLPGLFAAGLGGLPLGEPAPYRWPLWLVPLAHLGCAGLWSTVRPIRLAGGGPAAERAPLPMGLFVFFGLVTFLQTAGEGPVRAFFNIYLDAALNVPAAQIGVIFGAGQLLQIPAALLVPRLAGRWGVPAGLTLACLAVGLSGLILAVFRHPALAALGFLGFMAAVAVGAPCRSIFGQELVPVSWRTLISAVATIGVALGWASAAAAGGTLIAHAGYGGLFLFGALLALAAAALLAGARGFVRTLSRQA